MPRSSEWVTPEVFVEHAGTKVYHTYRHDDMDQGRSLNWYTLDPYSDESHFDARALFGDVIDHETRICAAMDAGLLELPEDLT